MVATNDPTGSRTAGVISRYAVALSAVPVAAWATDVTGIMFVVEGVILNGYALYMAEKFRKERTKANARRVFLTSLGYLPCWMMLFVLHSKTWDDEEEKIAKLEGAQQTFVVNNVVAETREGIRQGVLKVRDIGRDLCVHEAVMQKRATHTVESAEQGSYVDGAESRENENSITTVDAVVDP